VTTIKNNLPVLLLKKLVLLPHGESRIELNNDITKKAIEIAKLYHNNEILVVSPINDLEEKLDTGDLPKVGVIAKITSKIDIPNGNTRIVLKGEKRTKVLSYVNYSNEKDILESLNLPPEHEEYNEIEETALLRKLIGELDRYISINPYISNSILSQIKGITDLDKLTDYIANFLPLTFDKKLALMLDMRRTSRAKKLITEINIELAVLELENKIEQNLKRNLDNLQKEMLLKEKIKAINDELGIEDSKNEYTKDIEEKLTNESIPKHIKERIEKELKRYKTTPESSPEIGVITTYINTLLSIPWGIKTIDENNLKKVEDYLNSSHYGLKEAKERILEYISVNNEGENNSPIICLIGPPGVGKTTLAESIATSLNKNFTKISLGGINDPAELIGHRKTYIGSAPGKIINALIKSGSFNPVILLDEIDKMSKDYKGDPTSTLLDLLDPKQNKEFVDAYIEEGINLNEVTWVITANDRNEIPYVLLDRLEIIEVESYTVYEKTKIANNYLIPLSKEKNGIKNIEIYFKEEAIEKIITSYTKESGVRELERQINKIFRKIIVSYKLNETPIPNIINEYDIKKYLGIEKYLKNKKDTHTSGLALGLAYTPYGGEILEIEVTSYEGEEKFITSGYLGDTLEESIKVAISYIKTHKERFKMNNDSFKKTIHINFREGSIPKDGPSAGIVITSAIISHILNIKIPNYISMTGEITLLGDILPVGGIKEKSLAAIKEGIKIIYISRKNQREVSLLDNEIKNKIKFKFVNNYIEIFNDIFLKEGKNDKRK